MLHLKRISAGSDIIQEQDVFTLYQAGIFHLHAFKVTVLTAITSMGQFVVFFWSN
jgi:hypothetical protein